MQKKGWLQLTNAYNSTRLFIRVASITAVSEETGEKDIYSPVDSNASVYLGSAMFQTKETVENIYELVEKDASL